MSLRFRSLAELTGDLCGELTALVDGAAQPRFREVAVVRAPPGIAAATAQSPPAIPCRPPSAVVVPGPSEHPAEAARNLRRTSFTVWVIGSADAERPGSAAPLTTLVDAVVARFLPAAESPQTQVVLQGVIWEPTASAPGDAATPQLAARITLLASDFRQERS